jgi:hypothetical protein
VDIYPENWDIIAAGMNERDFYIHKAGIDVLRTETIDQNFLISAQLQGYANVFEMRVESWNLLWKA